MITRGHLLRVMTPMTALALALVVSPLAGGAAGALDPTFDGDGKVLTDFSDDSADVAYGVAAQSDGKIVVVGMTGIGGMIIEPNFAVARYAESGALDPTFDGDGKASTAFTPTSSEYAFAMAIQPDGKLLAAGEVTSDATNRNFALMRYNGDGTLDESFDGDGKVVTDFALGIEGAKAIAIQADGKIVLAGLTSPGPDPPDIALVRYLPNGSLDSSFDGDGRLSTPISVGSSDWANDLAVHADGRIVVAGATRTGGTTYALLVRYMPDGTLDGSFDGDGKLVVATPNTYIGAVALQQDGKIVTSWTPYFTVRRFNPDGSVDASFDGDGITASPFRPGGGVSDVAVQPDGKIVASGGMENDLGGEDFAVGRWTSSGALDGDFGLGGGSIVEFGADDWADALVLLPNGKVVAAGWSGRDIAVARFLGTGAAAPPPPPPPPPPPAPPPVRPPQPRTPARCVVPNVKRKTLAQARRLLTSKRCRLGRVAWRYSGTVRRGRVISQAPSAGRPLPGGTKVHVKASRGRRPSR